MKFEVVVDKASDLYSGNEKLPKKLKTLFQTHVEAMAGLYMDLSRMGDNLEQKTLEYSALKATMVGTQKRAGNYT